MVGVVLCTAMVDVALCVAMVSVEYSCQEFGFIMHGVIYVRHRQLMFRFVADMRLSHKRCGMLTSDK